MLLLRNGCWKKLESSLDDDERSLESVDHLRKFSALCDLIQFTSTLKQSISSLRLCEFARNTMCSYTSAVYSSGSF